VEVPISVTTIFVYNDTIFRSLWWRYNQVILYLMIVYRHFWLEPKVKWHNRRYFQKSVCILLNVSQIFRWLGNVRARATEENVEMKQSPVKTLVWTFRCKENACLFSIAPVLKMRQDEKLMFSHPCDDSNNDKSLPLFRDAFFHVQHSV
jgi:hypothetical protein